MPDIIFRIELADVRCLCVKESLENPPISISPLTSFLSPRPIYFNHITGTALKNCVY